LKPEAAEIELDFDNEEVESEVEAKPEMAPPTPKPRQKKWWDKLIDNTHEWFGDERVNSDNDFK
jgi:hypothetical protein